ncbi:MAG TPA: hypothetical protein VJ187_00165 [Nitrospirota bacterium]|nr:hypothetical protein [Nitrospirota bacterium]
MDKIEETLNLSPFFKALSQEEKTALVQKLLADFGHSSEETNEDNPPLLS